MKDTLPVRPTDPDTSHEAAEKVVTRRIRVRDAVLRILREHGPMTHEELVDRYVWEFRCGTVPASSASSIRTRCAELVDDGEVEMVPDETRRTAMGNRARLWRAVGVYESGDVVHV